MDSRLLYGANVHANGIRQHYLRFGGTGAPLILVPGITSPAATWAFVAERLSRHYDTYVLDIRGRGISESGPEVDYSLDACAADVAGLADALELPSFIILGHSMGARIALRASRSLGARIHKLVLVDPPVSGPGRRPYPIPLEFMLKGLHTAKGEPVSKKCVRSWLNGMIRKSAFARSGYPPVTSAQSKSPIEASMKMTSMLIFPM